MDRPLITAVRRLSFDDGPGLRTTVFLKGCPLACRWCHNPETIRPGPQLLLFAERCLGCGDCVPACPEHALDGTPVPRLRTDLCTACGRCSTVCPTGALRLAGRYYPPAELLPLLLRDRHFYAASGGGVTFSGGEPTMFPRYLSPVLRALKEHHVHVALQTAGHFAWPDFAALLLPYLDLVLYDLKLFDDAAHRRHTGRSNARILANFVRLCDDTDVPVQPRIPLIPGITDTEANLTALAGLVRGRRCRPVRLLPYNPGGGAKRRALGERPDDAARDAPTTLAEERRAREIVAAALAGDTGKVSGVWSPAAR